MNSQIKIIAVTGPTATGKTALAVKLAKRYNGEIVSVDSRQVYRGMDLGTGKDLAEYDGVPYWLIDVAEPNCEYSLGDFLPAAVNAIAQIHRNGHLPILCGGTALYLDALLCRYDLPGAPPQVAERAALSDLTLTQLAQKLQHDYPAVWAQISNDDRQNFLRLRRSYEIALHPQNLPSPVPANWQFLTLGVYYPRNVVRERIERRLDARLQAGLIAEVAALHEQGVSFERLQSFGLEYREIAKYLQKECDAATMRQSLLDKIRQFAKRQDIFFRKMERSGVAIYWLKNGLVHDSEQLIDDFLQSKKLAPPPFRLYDIVNARKLGC